MGQLKISLTPHVYSKATCHISSLVPRPLLFFVLQFGFHIHRSGIELKNKEDMTSFITYVRWIQIVHREEGPNPQNNALDH